MRIIVKQVIKTFSFILHRYTDHIWNFSGKEGTKYSLHLKYKDSVDGFYLLIWYWPAINFIKTYPFDKNMFPMGDRLRCRDERGDTLFIYIMNVNYSLVLYFFLPVRDIGRTG